MEDLASSIIRRQFWIIIILIFGLIISNGIWIWYINQFDFGSQTVEQDATSDNASSVTQHGIVG